MHSIKLQSNRNAVQRYKLKFQPKTFEYICSSTISTNDISSLPRKITNYNKYY